jgi:hypothetical protein
MRAVLVAISIVCTAQALAEPLTISGPSRVVDGDTVVVGGSDVRLKGVDATQVMMGIVNGSDLRCILTGEKTLRRIEMGMARACPRYDTRYVQFEQADAIAAQPRASYCVRR